MKGLGTRRCAAALALASALLLAATGRATAQETEEEKPQPPPSIPKLAGQAVVKEVTRYLSDSIAYVGAPLHWEKSDIDKFAGSAVIVGGLIAADPTLYRNIQNTRSNFTNNVAAATTVFGAGGAWGTAGGLIIVGLVSGSDGMRDMGRDSLETLVFATTLNDLILKPGFGRWRPIEADGQNKFEPFSKHNSFPSGHAVTAWSVASVVAMRAPGWIIPTIAYGLATVVAFDRVNDQAHFMGDVVAGALFATATGRFLVKRHLGLAHTAGTDKESSLSIEVVPIRDGAALRFVF
ncbi:MAG TPA: phosphatase PAP2 family protein [Thermoanaerobaculia bacterium]|nr:phosphatase PAP2 family protein [Thermoanaerobaculia bacterium]